MKSIIYVGLDVHKSSFTLCSLKSQLYGQDVFFAHMKIKPEAREVKKYLDRLQERLKKETGKEHHFVCGYEAGCMGYTLYHDLTRLGIECLIMAPSSMLVSRGKTIKTDKRDAERIAKSLADGNFSPVYIPDATDEQVRDYIRMRNDHQGSLKKIKQQINAFCLRLGHVYQKSKWTAGHLTWLHQLDLDSFDRETLDNYLFTYDYMSCRIEQQEQRIEEFAEADRYKERVQKLQCFIGVKTYTALSVLVEIGDFERFKTAENFACYLGLVPGENTSNERVKRTGITKAGNSQVRRLLVEAGHSLCRGSIGYKSKELKRRQRCCSAEVIAYADRANERIRRKGYRMIKRGKQRNIVVTAAARELACFIWGMMTNNLEPRMVG